MKHTQVITVRSVPTSGCEKQTVSAGQNHGCRHWIVSLPPPYPSPPPTPFAATLLLHLPLVFTSCRLHPNFIPKCLKTRLEISRAFWLRPCFVFKRLCDRIQAGTSDSQAYFFLRSLGDHHLSYGLCALSDALGTELNVLLRETKHIWRKPEGERSRSSTFNQSFQLNPLWFHTVCGSSKINNQQASRSSLGHNTQVFPAVHVPQFVLPVHTGIVVVVGGGGG
ncbi:hypothetical protein BsWGS_11773 [Bradybaena similaris]